MNAPPEKRNPDTLVGVPGRIRDQTTGEIDDTEADLTPQVPIFTATPRGRAWGVDCVAGALRIAYRPLFAHRQPALAWARRLARETGGAVLP